MRIVEGTILNRDYDGRPMALCPWGWADKARRAERVAANTGTQADTNALAKEAELRGKGETVLQLAKLQLTKSERFALSIGVIDGMTKSALDRLNFVTNTDAIEPVIKELKEKGTSELQALIV